jgi:hypothetical protein
MKRAPGQELPGEYPGTGFFVNVRLYAPSKPSF